MQGNHPQALYDDCLRDRIPRIRRLRSSRPIPCHLYGCINETPASNVTTNRLTDAMHIRIRDRTHVEFVGVTLEPAKDRSCIGPCPTVSSEGVSGNALGLKERWPRRYPLEGTLYGSPDWFVRKKQDTILEIVYLHRFGVICISDGSVAKDISRSGCRLIRKLSEAMPSCRFVRTL
jgi:hypothetical protein